MNYISEKNKGTVKVRLTDEMTGISPAMASHHVQLQLSTVTVGILYWLILMS